MGYSCTFVVGIHGYSWVFMGIHVSLCSTVCKDSLVSCRFSCEMVSQGCLWRNGNVIRAEFNYNTISAGRSVENNG